MDFNARYNWLIIVEKVRLWTFRITRNSSLTKYLPYNTIGLNSAPTSKE